MLRALLARTWWVFLLRGLVAILFGVVALRSSVAALATLVLFFGAYAMVDGGLTVVAAFRGQKLHNHWILMLLSGIAEILVGVFTFRSPLATLAVLMLFIGIWAILVGATQIVMAIRLRKEIEGEFWMGLGGLLSILFGLAAIGTPGLAALATLRVLAFFALAFGIVLCLLAFKVKGLAPKAA